MKNKYKIRTITCAKCGKVDTKRRPDGQKYCSLECYRTSPRPSREKGQYKPCGTCGKPIWVVPSTEKKVNYCSIGCYSADNSRKIEYVCKVCGKFFWWSPSRLKSVKYTPKYCSIKCRNDCPEWKRNASIAANLKQQNSSKPTSLEIAGCALLDLLDIKYETQVLICDKFTVDVYIPSHNLVIQWDGDYWHGFGGAKDDRQRKRQQLDKSQDAYMKKAGFKVIRFWEHEVKKEALKVIEYIRKAIQ